MKQLLSFLLFCLTITSFSQEKKLTGTQLDGAVRLSFIPVEMPTDKFPGLDKTMGLLGVHYQLYANDWWYAGASMRSAVTGDQGGLFTLGVESGVSKKIIDNIYLDANLHFGGGGGYRNLVNGGAMLNTNLGFAYKKNGYSAGMHYSYINFLDGKIKSNSIGFFLEIPTQLRKADYNTANQTYSIEQLDSFWKIPSTKNVQQLRFDFLTPRGNSKKDNGDPLTETLYSLGFEYQRYLTNNTFLFAHTDAIYKGLRAGYMDLFIGAGHNVVNNNQLHLFAKLGLGAGGGRIAPEGGLTVYPSAGLDYYFTENIGISAHTGYYKALAGDFEASTLGFGVKYRTFNGGTTESNSYKTQGIKISVENQTYFDIQKTDAPSTDLQLIGLKFTYDVFHQLYLLGEASFAYKGESGGYAHGMAGLGYNFSPILNNVSIFTEIAGGAAGGAGVDTGEGIVIRPTLGLNIPLSKDFEAKVSGGKIFAAFGNLDATNFNIGITYKFATLTSKNK